MPGQPIRRLILSHAHADHAGGVRAFAAEGAEIVVAAGAAAPVRRFLEERFELAPGRYEAVRHTARVVIREVADAETFGSGAERIEVLPVGENPHSSAMAVVWIPRHRIVLQGDLFYAEPIETFPSPSRLPIMKWFADWLEARKLRPTSIFGTHDEAPGSQAHLDKLSKTPLEP